ncbi:hypothetical protein HZS_7605, partial [Henneguya salminicola]
MVYKINSCSDMFWCPPAYGWSCLYNLPYSYELGLTHEGLIYFINHSNKTTTNILPSEPIFDQLANPINPKSLPKNPVKERILEIQLPKKIKNTWITTRKHKNQLIVDKVEADCPFTNKIYVGDILQSIDGVKLFNQKDIYDNLKLRTSATVSIKKMNFMPQYSLNPSKIKSSLKRTPNENEIKEFPTSVHFSETPVIVRYNNDVSDMWSSISLDKSFTDIVKIHMPDGTFRTHRFENNQVVFELVCTVLRQLLLEQESCFTLALLAGNSPDIEYFGHNDLVSTLIEKKKSRHQAECYLLIYTYPTNLMDWSNPKYAPIINLMFHQFRFFLLTARFPNICSKPVHNINQLIGLSSTIDFLMSRSNIEMHSNFSEFPEPPKSDDISGNNQNPCNLSNNIRLSTFNLEQHDIFPSYATIIDKRKDIDVYKIQSLMINAFDILTPDDLKIYYLGDKSLRLRIYITQEKFYQEISVILQKSKICFINACIDSKITPASQYRVVVQNYMGQKSNKGMPQNGIPETIVLTSKTIDIYEQKINRTITNFSDISAVVIPFKDKEYYLVTIFSKSCKHMTIKLKENQFGSFLWILSAGCNEMWRDSPVIKVPFIDLSNPEYRCKGSKLPEYKDIHLVIPSNWNYLNHCGKFFAQLNSQLINQQINLNDSMLPFLMKFSIPEHKDRIKFPFECIPILSLFHLKLNYHFQTK